MTTTLAPLDTLTEPVTLAGLPLRSRFAMAPMTRYHSPGGVPTAEVAAYYRRRAEGGVGLVITEGILVDHPSAGHETDVPRLTAGAAERGWRRVTGEVHAAGGRIAAQLWHQGSERGGGRRAWTPSGHDGTHAMTGADFERMRTAYAESARTAVRAGFDAVEIHAAHGYLLDEFLWPRTNRRSDRYGGPAARRAAFPAEVIRAVRAEIPAAMPLIVRFSQFKERDSRRPDRRLAGRAGRPPRGVRRRGRRRSARLPAPLLGAGVPGRRAESGRLGQAPDRPAHHHGRLGRPDPRLPRLTPPGRPGGTPRGRRVRPGRARPRPARQPGLGTPGRGRPPRRDPRLPQGGRGHVPVKPLIKGIPQRNHP